MKLSHLFVLSAAAVVPAGAIGADPQVDMRTNLGTIRLELYRRRRRRRSRTSCSTRRTATTTAACSTA